MRAIKFADIGREIPGRTDLRVASSCTGGAPAETKVVAAAPRPTVNSQHPPVKPPQHP